MYTFSAIVGVVIVGWLAQRNSWREREKTYDRLTQSVEDEYLRAILLHIRQDVQLGVFLLGLVIVFLGILADLLARH